MAIAGLAVGVKSVGMLMVWQAQGASAAIDSSNTKLLIILSLIALAMVSQAAIAVALGIGALKLQKELMVHVADLKVKALPLMDQSNLLMEELRPQIAQITGRVDAIAGHVEQLTGIVTAKAAEISPTIAAANDLVGDASRLTRAQIYRVDGMVSSALDTTARFGATIEAGIAKPVREAVGVIAGIRAALDVLFRGLNAISQKQAAKAQGRYPAEQ
jgi:uncharacterized protein YoxC